jgi:hypothetical protein
LIADIKEDEDKSTVGARSRGGVDGLMSSTLVGGYAIPLAKRIKIQLDTGRYSQFLKDAIEVVSDRMFLHFELLGEFAVLETNSSSGFWVVPSRQAIENQAPSPL